MRPVFPVSACALLVFLVGGCSDRGESASDHFPPDPSLPDPHPPEVIPTEVVRREQHVPTAIAPYVLDLAGDRVSFAWVTRSEQIGELEISGEEGTRTLREESRSRYHRIEVQDLVPASSYAYTIDGYHRGKVATPSGKTPFSFGVFGHPGGSMGRYDYPYGLVGERFGQLDVDFALCTGDLCYYTNESSFAELFFRPFGDFLSRKPIYVTPGNHEAGFPIAYGFDYEVFRRLFPYDYPNKHDAYHAFVRGNVHFIAVAYSIFRVDKFELQLDWLRQEIASSRSEFRLVYLGGDQDPPGFDRTRLFQTLAEGGVDLVFGGDGFGVRQEEIEGLPFFFAGTQGSAPHNFYVVDVQDYLLRVRQYDAAMQELKRGKTFYTRQPKKVVMELTRRGVLNDDVPLALDVLDIGARSGTFHGLKVTVRNPINASTVLWVRWSPKHTLLQGSGRFFREQAIQLVERATGTYFIPLPAINPRTDRPWVLDDIQLRLEHPDLSERYDLRKSILQLALFIDPLKTLSNPR